MDHFYAAAKHRSRGALWPFFPPARIDRHAYHQHNLEGFEEYVNVESVVSNAFDQIVVTPITKEAQQDSTSTTDGTVTGMSIAALAD